MTPEDIFSCRMCGDCCRGYGGTYVTDREIGAISRYVGCAPERFAERYCRWSGKRLLLAQNRDGYCIFYDRRCTIHPVKPRMCRSWPFIRAVLVDVKNWYAMADSCPGMRTDVTEAQIRRAVEQAILRPQPDGKDAL